MRDRGRLRGLAHRPPRPQAHPDRLRPPLRRLGGGGGAAAQPRRVRGRAARGRPRDRCRLRPRPALHRGDLAARDPRAAGLAQPDGDRDRHPPRLLRELAPLVRGALLLALDVRLGRDPLRRLPRGASLRSGVAALPRGEGSGGGGPRRPREGGGRPAGPPRAPRDPGHDRPGVGHVAGALREAAAQAARDRGLPRRLPAGHRDQHRHLLRLPDLQGARGRAERLGGDRRERDHRERELPDDDRGPLDDRSARPPAADDAGLGRHGVRPLPARLPLPFPAAARGDDPRRHPALRGLVRRGPRPRGLGGDLGAVPRPASAAGRCRSPRCACGWPASW